MAAPIEMSAKIVGQVVELKYPAICLAFEVGHMQIVQHDWNLNPTFQMLLLADPFKWLVLNSLHFSYPWALFDLLTSRIYSIR